MSTSEEIQIDPRILKVLAYIMVGIVIVAIYMGIQAAYFENGQWIYFTLVVLGVVCAAVNTMLPRKELLIAAGVLVIVGLGVSTLKFDWRRTYIQDSLVAPFPYEAYIDQYPTYEEHILNGFGFGQNWVGFTNKCHDSLKQGKKIPKSCKDVAEIKKTFGIDMKAVLRTHFQRMKKTANLISKGRMKRKVQFENCLSKKDCALVPMLPEGISADAITEDSREHLHTRRTFWEIIDNKVVTPKVCNFIDLCRDLAEMGAINPSNPKI